MLCLEGIKKLLELRNNNLMICVVDGLCLGGGLEASLCCDFIIASEKSSIGFPEIRFNLFPAMGAYPLLLNRVDSISAKKILLSGKIYNSKEAQSLNIIDFTYKTNKQKEALINSLNFSRKNIFLDYKKLEEDVILWASCAMRLDQKDLDILNKLIKKQKGLKIKFLYLLKYLKRSHA